MVRILAISGSLRAGSSNTTLLEAAAIVSPPEVEVILFDGLASLPHFNPDLEGSDQPLPPVLAFRAALQSADAVLICSPEYAHGVPGSLKNALDWVVGTGEFVRKPVALLNASPRATHAQASLREILTTMDSLLVPSASLDFPILGLPLTAPSIASHPDLSPRLRTAISELVAAAQSRSENIDR